MCELEDNKDRYEHRRRQGVLTVEDAHLVNTEVLVLLVYIPKAVEFTFKQTGKKTQNCSDLLTIGWVLGEEKPENRQLLEARYLNCVFLNNCTYGLLLQIQVSYTLFCDCFSS